VRLHEEPNLGHVRTQYPYCSGEDDGWKFQTRCIKMQPALDSCPRGYWRETVLERPLSSPPRPSRLLPPADSRTVVRSGSRVMASPHRPRARQRQRSRS